MVASGLREGKTHPIPTYGSWVTSGWSLKSPNFIRSYLLNAKSTRGVQHHYRILQKYSSTWRFSIPIALLHGQDVELALKIWLPRIATGHEIFKGVVGLMLVGGYQKGKTHPGWTLRQSATGGWSYKKPNFIHLFLLHYASDFRVWYHSGIASSGATLVQGNSTHRVNFHKVNSNGQHHPVIFEGTCHRNQPGLIGPLYDLKYIHSITLTL